MGSVSGGFPCAVHADAETGEIRRWLMLASGVWLYLWQTAHLEKKQPAKQNDSHAAADDAHYD